MQLPIILCCSVIIFILQINVIVTQRDSPVEVVPVILNGTTGECPPDVNRQMSKDLLRNTTRDILRNRNTFSSRLSQNCGPGMWRRVFYLNSSNSDESCPGAWNTVTNPTRACRGASRSCRSTFSDDVNTAYSKVCGRLIGDAINSPDAFHSNRESIENNYLDGVSITHGQSGSRSHIWSLAAGHKVFGDHREVKRCPCDNDNRNEAPLPPPAVGENYFCDRFDGLNRLWEGANCAVDDPCCSFNNPPYFSVQLPMPTTDRIELRICNNQDLRDESVKVLFAEVYVQ